MGFIFLLAVSGFMQFRTPAPEVFERFEKQGISIEMHEYRVGKRTQRYYRTGLENVGGKPLIIFVHGAPGSSHDFISYLEDEELLKKFSMISIDRPGYGYSNFGWSIKSMESQAKLLGMLLDSIPEERNVILVGHSFGGPIIAKMGSLFPDKIDAMLLLAPALDPMEEKFLFLAKVCKTPPFWWLAPWAWKVASDEKSSHVEELKKMDADWGEITCRVIHMHGTEDSLVPYKNIMISKEKMINADVSIISLKGADHFLPWSHKDEIKEVLNSLAQHK
jgi:pimeloyl-ACP methyl ester carboxylesterase